jgi:hypothetical protein
MNETTAAGTVPPSSSPAAQAGAPCSILELPPDTDRNVRGFREYIRDTLEAGGILFLPRAGFELSERERTLVADAAVTLPSRRERESRNGRPTLIYDPARGHILRTRISGPEREELEAMMARYSEWASSLVADLLPDYTGKLVRDRLTYRPCERADAQGLHVDASYGRPTEGRGMLRVFCNIHPGGRARIWRVGETFEPFARRFVPSARTPRTSRLEALLAHLGVTRGRRTAYDRLMADIRGQVKKDEDYQTNAPQRIVSFPPGSAWIAITDLVLHGASSGQHSLDQTFFLPPEAMDEPARSSLRILERLSGRTLL